MGGNLGNIGTGFARSSRGLGPAIAGQITAKHAEHVDALRKEGALQELQKYAVDPSGNLVQYDPNAKDKDKNLTPFIQPKVLEMAQGNVRDQRERSRGALDVATQIGMRQIVHQMTQGPQYPVQIPGVGTVNLTGGQVAQYGVATQRAAAQAPATAALIKARESRGKLTDIQIAQQMGLIPKPAQPPTGASIVAEQARQRRERFTQRKDIADTLAVNKILDPQMLLDESAISFGEKDKFGRWYPKPKDQAKFAQIEDGPLLPIKEFNRLQGHAQKWQELGKTSQPPPTVRPEDAQKLIQNPTAEMKAMFDKAYGQQGAADLILNAVQPSNAEPPADQPDEVDTAEE